jgi:adenylate cyclase
LERRLAAILAADVVGYSRLMEDDEEATARTLSTYREIIEGLIASHHGRVFGSAGDSVIAEFASPVEAVRCAVNIQRELEAHNVDLAEDRHMRLRIGVNLGDVMVEGDNLLGDGVNIAARLETLADPGGISLARSVFDQVRKQLDLGYEYLGEHEVKNIAEPVRVYRVLTAPEAAGKVIGEAKRATQPWKWAAVAAVVAVLIGVAGAVTWLRPWEPTIEPASVERMAFPLPDRPSIAVLPFTNMSGDPEQEYFADGLTEDVITGLSRFPDLFVVARNSTFSYKGQQVPVKRIAEELGVRYVLEGSVQMAGGTVRMTAQLIDATTGHHLWAESYDRKLTDVFAVRDEVTQTIIATVMGDTGQLTRAEIERVSGKDPENLQAYELVLKGVDIWLRFTPEANREAAVLFDKAIALDPGYARAYAVLAWVHLNDYRYLWSEDPQQSFALAYDLARKSVALDDTDDWSHWALGVVHLYRREYGQAEIAYRRAIEINPNYADLLAHTGLFLTFAGKPEEAIDQIKTAMRLNPHYGAWYPSELGFAQYLAGQYEPAAMSLKEAIDRNPGSLWDHQRLAATYARLGRTDQARDEVNLILEMNPEFSITEIGRGLPFKNSTDLEVYLEGLRLAGLPE